MTADRIEFSPDDEVSVILAAVPAGEVDAYINHAIKLLAALQQANESTGQTQQESTSVAPAVSAELQRLFGRNGGAIKVVALEGSPEVVTLSHYSSGKTAKLDLVECTSVLKSLRQPIEPAEVWDILDAMKIG